MLIIEPTYMPDWIKDGDPPGNSMELQFVGGSPSLIQSGI
jgi:hypothetical protein